MPGNLYTYYLLTGVLVSIIVVGAGLNDPKMTNSRILFRGTIAIFAWLPMLAMLFCFHFFEGMIDEFDK